MSDFIRLEINRLRQERDAARLEVINRTRERDEARALLVELEWSGGAVAGLPTCLFCGVQRGRPHATGDTLAGPRCRLDAALGDTP